MLNRYYNTYKAVNEQSLHNSLIVESIQINGVEVLYIKRDNADIDTILREPTISSFSDTYSIEMYDTTEGQQFDESSFMSKFGFRTEDEGDFIVAISRWETVVKAVDAKLSQPRAGDLLYVGNITSQRASYINTLFEITRVTVGMPNKFSIGKNLCYRLMCKVYTPDHSTFDTGTVLDNVVNNYEDFGSINDAVEALQPTLLVAKGNPFGEI